MMDKYRNNLVSEAILGYFKKMKFDKTISTIPMSGFINTNHV